MSMSTPKTSNNLSYMAQPGDGKIKVIVPTRTPPAASARFDHFVKNLDRFAHRLSITSRVIACALAYESFCNENQLIGFLNGSQHATRFDPDVVVGWQDHNGRQCRRVLSPRTTLALAELAQPVRWDWELKEFLTVLMEHYPGAQNISAKDLWLHVFNDSAAWLYLVLPGYLLAYLMGELNCRLLSDSTLRRKYSPHQQPSGTTDSLCTAHAEPAAIDAVLGAGHSTGNRAMLIGPMKALFQAPGDSCSVRVSDRAWRSQLTSKIDSLASELTQFGTATDGLLLWWICYLLTVGSLRLANPTVATVARYFQALCDLVSHEMATQAAGPHDLCQDKWEQVFRNLQAATDGAPAKTALASFHMFCVESLGMEPCLSVASSDAHAPSRVNANVVWEHEVQRCLYLCQEISTDERVTASLDVMLALEDAMSFRIGELRSLHLCDITFCDDYMEVHFHPFADEHSGKTRQARRIMRTGVRFCIVTVRQWRDRRTKEGATEDDYLFGDPHSPHKLYRFGECAHLLSQLLKAVTGDQEVHIHSMRHTWFTREILESQEQYQGTNPVSALQKIATQGGHASELTSLEHYFHCPEWAIRRSIDGYLERHVIKAEHAAAWLGCKSATLRKAKQRADSSDRCYIHKLRQRAASVFAAVDHKVIVEDVTTSGETGLPWLDVRKVLCDILAGFTEESICLRTGVRASDLARIVTIATNCAALLAHEPLDVTSRRSVWSNSAVASGPDLIEACNRLGLTMQLHGGEPYLTEFIDKVGGQRTPSRELNAAALSWMSTKTEHCIDLSAPEAARPLLSLLSQHGVSTGCVTLRVGCDDPTNAHCVATALNSSITINALSTCTSVFRLRPRVEPVKRRRGIPAAYLLIARRSNDSHALMPSAMLRMNRFHAAMFVTAVWCGLDGGQMGVAQ